MRFLKREEGIAMPLVLLVMVVLALLGTALWQYSVNDVAQVAQAENKARAYYVARAGAESLARYIMNNPDQINVILGQDSQKISKMLEFETDLLGKAGDLEVTLRRSSNNRIEVTGEGRTEGVQQTVRIVLETQPFFGDAAVVTTGTALLNFHSGMTIEGSIIAGGDVKPDNLHQNSTKYSITRNYPFTDDTFVRVVVPTIQFSATINKLDIKNKNVYQIAADSRIKFGEIDNKGTLVINPGSWTEVGELKSGTGDIKIITQKDRQTILVVDSMDLKARLIIEGDGPIDIYVRRTANIQTSNAVIMSNALLTFFLVEGCDITIQANGYFDALIYGPHRTKVIMQGNPTFRGAMIVGSLSGNGTYIGQNGLIQFYKGFADQGIKPVVNLLYWVP